MLLKNNQEAGEKRVDRVGEGWGGEETLTVKIHFVASGTFKKMGDGVVN